MEAAVADREAEMTEWSDGRLDDLSKRVDELGTRMDDGFKRVNQRIDRLDDGLRHLGTRFDALQRTLVQMNVVIVAALIGVIATQL
jgi:hypothetical protein